MIRLIDETMRAARLHDRARAEAREGVAAQRPDGLRVRADGRVSVVTISGVVGPGEDACVHPAALAAALRRVAGEDQPPAVVLELDSPGGYLPGFADVEDALAALAARKTLYAAAHEQASSLAYWMACYAHWIVATSSAVVGSIGVLSEVADTSAQAAMYGVRVHAVTDAPGKLVGYPGVPQDEGHTEFVRRQLEPLGQRFRAMVARARRMDETAIRALQGASMFGPEALAAGLVDEVVAWQDWIEALAGGEVSPPMATTQTTKGAGMAAKTTGAAAAALSEKDLVAKYPDRKDEIKGAVAKFVRELGESLAAEPAAEPAPEPATEPVGDGAGEADTADTDDTGVAGAVATDEGDAAALEDDDRQSAAPPPLPQGSAARAMAPASLEALETLGKGSDFVVAAAKAQLTLAQARVLSAGWAAAATAAQPAGHPAGQPAPTPAPTIAARGVPPLRLAPGAAAHAADFTGLVRARAEQTGLGLADAALWAKEHHPEAWAKAQAQQQQRRERLNFGRA